MIYTKHPHPTQMNKEAIRNVTFICIQTQIRRVKEAVEESGSALLKWFRLENIKNHLNVKCVVRFPFTFTSLRLNSRRSAVKPNLCPRSDRRKHTSSHPEASTLESTL